MQAYSKIFHYSVCNLPCQYEIWPAIGYSNHLSLSGIPKTALFKQTIRYYSPESVQYLVYNSSVAFISHLNNRVSYQCKPLGMKFGFN